MGMRGVILGGLMLATLAAPLKLRGQDLVKESLASFPPQTIRVEYSRLAKLRSLPNYQNLRQRFVGPRLRALEESFAQLGLGESDIDEVVLAWQPGSSMMEMEGLTVGRFTAKSVSDRASAAGISPTTLNDLPAFCLGADAATCVVVIQNSLGGFAPQASLSAMLEARGGLVPGLGTNERFAKLVNEARTDAPIWGVAVGDAVADFFRAWMPAQGGLQMDWSSAFKAVEAVSYSVQTSDRIRLDIKMDCDSSGSAQSTRQVLEGLKMFQQMAWQNTNPGKPNPFAGVEIEQSDRRVSLRLTTNYADIEGFTTSGGAGN